MEPSPGACQGGSFPLRPLQKDEGAEFCFKELCVKLIWGFHANVCALSASLLPVTGCNELHRGRL